MAFGLCICGAMPLSFYQCGNYCRLRKKEEGECGSSFVWRSGLDFLKRLCGGAKRLCPFHTRLFAASERLRTVHTRLCCALTRLRASSTRHLLLSICFFKRNGDNFFRFWMKFYIHIDTKFFLILLEP